MRFSLWDWFWRVRERAIAEREERFLSVREQYLHGEMAFETYVKEWPKAYHELYNWDEERAHQAIMIRLGPKD